MSSLTKLFQGSQTDVNEGPSRPNNTPDPNVTSRHSNSLEPSHLPRNSRSFILDSNIRQQTTTSVTTVTQLTSEESTEDVSLSIPVPNQLPHSSGTNGTSNLQTHGPSASFLDTNSAHTAIALSNSVNTAGQRDQRMYHNGTSNADGATPGSIYNTISGASSNRTSRGGMMPMSTGGTNGSSHGHRNIPSLSSSIPYSVPNSNKDGGSMRRSSSTIMSSSWIDMYGGGMPNNISAIDSNIISSPVVDAVEPRFVISKQKFQKVSQENATHSASVSRSNSLSSQLGSLFFSKSTKDPSAESNSTVNQHSNNGCTNTENNNNLHSNNYDSNHATQNNHSIHNFNMTDANQSSAIQSLKAAAAAAGTPPTAIPKHPSRARVYGGSKQYPQSSYTEYYGMAASPQQQQGVEYSQISNLQKSQPQSNTRHSSMIDFKRFFKRSSSNASNSYSPSSFSGSYVTTKSMHSANNEDFQFPSSLGNQSIPNSTSIPSSHSIENSQQIDNSALTFSPDQHSDTLYSTDANTTLQFSEKYKMTGEDLGAGAGGSVKLVERIADKKIFAVKEFRAKYENENKRDYVKKITSEYCIGTTLRHQNIIETIEIIYENERILQVLEYCEYDLFAIVMSNKMSYAEVACCFKQILTGIQYLHSLGLAHRDLKLDNCVINKDGIVKLIDFGAAVVFSYPFSKNLVEASGIVGSDPYLAPEVCIFAKYDPRPVDIWSSAIIFSCMILKKFPWKLPKLKDNSFKLFCSGRDCDSLSQLVTKTPNPPSYDNVEATSTSDYSPQKPKSNNPSDPQNMNIGPQRLLHALPEESQSILNRMIDLAPACRANIDEIMEDPWVKSIEMCHLEANGLDYSMVRGSDHTHTQVDQSEAHIAGLEKKKHHT